MSKLRPPARPPAPQSDWAYFFDLDGTLIEFADTPGAVHVSEDVRQLLEQLHARTGGAVALMSGRSIAEIDRLFPHARMAVAGQHGLERRSAGGHVSQHAFPLDRLDDVRRRITAALAGKTGLLFEDKGLSVALHYRQVPRLGAFAHRVARGALRDAGGGAEFSLQRGKYVVEIRPAGRNKGASVLEFMNEAPFQGRMPVFVGDDATDEFGFVTVNQLGGHAVKVGGGRTAARWRLVDVRDVRAWLAQPER